MEKDVMYTLCIYNKNIHDIETQIKRHFNVKFLAYDQYELKISFNDELSDNDEGYLFAILQNIDKN